jgi:hypothetical protein
MNTKIMETQAYYNGTAFVPVLPLDIQTGAIFNLNITQANASSSANKAAVFEQITSSLRSINHAEPLPAEFDSILTERMRFNNHNGENYDVCT